MRIDPGMGPGGTSPIDSNKLAQLLKEFGGNINVLIKNLRELKPGEPIPPDLKELISDLAGQAGNLEQLPGLSNQQIAHLHNIRSFLQNIYQTGTINDQDNLDLDWIQNAVGYLLFTSD